MADKSPRQHQSKKAGKSLKEKRAEKKAKQGTAKPRTLLTNAVRGADDRPISRLAEPGQPLVSASIRLTASRASGI